MISALSAYIDCAIDLALSVEVKLPIYWVETETFLCNALAPSRTPCLNPASNKLMIEDLAPPTKPTLLVLVV